MALAYMKEHLQKVLAIIKPAHIKGVSFCGALLIALTFTLVLHVSMDMGSAAENQV